MLYFIKLAGLGKWSEVAWVEYVAPIVSVALAMLLIYLLGLIGGNVIGRQLFKSIDRLLMQVPFIRGIYSATRQFLDTFSVLFLLCSFGIIEWSLFPVLLLNGFAFKLLVALLDTPILYLCVYWFRSRFGLQPHEEIALQS